jgi:hypothetical protein
MPNGFVYLFTALGGLVATYSYFQLADKRRSKKDDPRPTEDSQKQTEADNLESLSKIVWDHLRKYQPAVIDGFDHNLHYLPPHVSKKLWDKLGDRINAVEKSTPSHGRVSGERWISLRLDGSGFSKTVKSLRRQGILESQGFSEVFAECMKTCCEELVGKFKAKVGYTQSDEMIVFIPPASVVRGEQQSHERGGRVTKLTTLAASFVTAKFNLQLAKLSQGKVDELLKIAPHFDCRSDLSPQTKTHKTLRNLSRVWWPDRR